MHNSTGADQPTNQFPIVGASLDASPPSEVHHAPTFADERARVAWEVAQAIERITPALPTESRNLAARLITFDPEQARRGRYALFLCGTVIGTDQPGVFLVPGRSLRVLDELQIPYHYPLSEEEPE